MFQKPCVLFSRVLPYIFPSSGQRWRPLGGDASLFVWMGEEVVSHGGIPKVSTYSVSKAALNAMTKMHAYELQEARIRLARVEE